jgi:hypothetical protein
MEFKGLLSALESAVATSLSRRVAENRPTRIALLDGETVLSRLAVPDDALPPRSATDFLTMSRLLWQPVARLNRVLDAPVRAELARIMDVRAWRTAALAFQTATACLVVKSLAENMNAKLLCEVNDSGEDIFQAHGDCAATIHRAERLMENILQRISRAIGLARDNPSGQASAAVQLEFHGQNVQIVHLDGQEERVFQEPLLDFVRRVASPELTALSPSARDFHDRLPHYGDLGKRVLREVCPVISAIEERVVVTHRCLGVRMFRTEFHGFPVEVLLFIDPPHTAEGSGYVHLIARRAHSEFILENERQPPEWFWFPAVQIQARLIFVPDQRIWKAVSPEIRVPKDGIGLFVHPYTGPLEEDPFSRAPVLNDDGGDVVAPVSEVAQRLFAAGLAPNGTARLRDMCLPGQEGRIAQLEAFARERAARGGRIEVFNLIQGIWQLARQGLCRAHQDNDSRPRVALNAESMPYQIRDRHAVANSRLAARVFRYHSV